MTTAGARQGLVLLFVFAFAWERAPGNDRFALVIGNQQYQSGPILRNPENDAHAVEDELEKLGFTVTRETNLGKTALEDVVSKFEHGLPSNCVALFYFAGHGLQANGENYLVPVDAKLQNADQVQNECLSVSRVLGAMDGANSRLKVVLLDCCRDNPFARNWGRQGLGRGQQGLVEQKNIPQGTIIAFATAPGMVAFDGMGQNSPYTGALCEALSDRPLQGLVLQDVIFTASRYVKRLTGQTPWVNMDATLKDFYLWRQPHFVARPVPTNRPEPPQPLQHVIPIRPAVPQNPIVARLNKDLLGKRVSIKATKPDRHGRWFRWEELTAKYVLIAFYDRSCQPCRAEIAEIKRAFDAFPDRTQFDVVGMDLDADDTTREAMRREMGIEWENLYTNPPPPNSLLSPYFDISSEPRAMLVRIDRPGDKGVVVEVSASGEQLMPILRRHLAPVDVAIQ